MRFDSCFKTNVFGGATRVGKVTQSGRHRKVSHFLPDSAVWPHPIPYLTCIPYLPPNIPMYGTCFGVPR